MTRLGKVLLLAEIAVCFIPISILLWLGIVMLPMQVWYLATTEAVHFTGALLLVAYVAAGICGLIALYCVMRWLLYGIRANLRPKIVLFLMCVGLTPLIFVALHPEAEWKFMVVLPLICSAHLLWLSRDYLFVDA